MAFDFGTLQQAAQNMLQGISPTTLINNQATMANMRTAALQQANYAQEIQQNALKLQLEQAVAQRQTDFIQALHNHIAKGGDYTDAKGNLDPALYRTLIAIDPTLTTNLQTGFLNTQKAQAEIKKFEAEIQASKRVKLGKDERLLEEDTGEGGAAPPAATTPVPPAPTPVVTAPPPVPTPNAVQPAAPIAAGGTTTPFPTPVAQAPVTSTLGTTPGTVPLPAPAPVPRGYRVVAEGIQSPDDILRRQHQQLENQQLQAKIQLDEIEKGNLPQTKADAMNRLGKFIPPGSTGSLGQIYRSIAGLIDVGPAEPHYLGDQIKQAQKMMDTVLQGAAQAEQLSPVLQARNIAEKKAGFEFEHPVDPVYTASKRTSTFGRTYVNIAAASPDLKDQITAKALAEGIPVVDKEDAHDLQQGSVAAGLLQDLQNQLNGKNKATPLGRAAGIVTNKALTISQADPGLAAYNNTVAPAIVALKALVGSGGGFRMTQVEVNNQIATLPTPNDTIATARTKVANFLTMLRTKENDVLKRPGQSSGAGLSKNDQMRQEMGLAPLGK